ncbi:cytochrome c family protein [Croceibacterium sp. LX-88]|uniref:Cytochrome c family protein n=1 Tax=Croceibacterium selenioxidans TaxID=2838833 RepID=A0ABS5W5J1_9SPHN|nr:cytochrome c3 family protein [Croceibacterium selenioxidans]MBT2135020.1 cytochrome c family protein [Croceibacterium selenioxidans]
MFLIRSIDQTATGREIVRERAVEGNELTIGRAAENDIHLADLAVEQNHVRIVPASGGRLRLQATGTLGFTVDGRSTTDVTIDPRDGAELGLGSYRLSFAREGDSEVTVTVRRTEERQTAKVDEQAGFSLAAVMPSKRKVAWASLALILLAFLAVPIWSHINRERVAPGINKPDAVLMDASWRTGSLSSVHHGLEDNCEACHTEPFVAVRDETCLTCHKDIGDHSAEPRLASARGPMSWGDKAQWGVAHAFHKPGPGACTDCHTEHEGAGRMEPTREQFCSDCHGSLDQRLTDTALGNAEDFGKLHPQFQAAIFTAPGQEKLSRASLDDRPKQWNGLRFPHDMHLSKANGVAQMSRRLGTARGYGQPLDCASCHTPTADGVRFLPVDMEKDCESCHSLVFDRIGTTFRTLRHGDVEQMRAELVALDARTPRNTGRRRPGEYGSGGVYRANFGGPGTALMTGAMSEKGLCGECHTPAASGATLKVLPVTQQSRFFIHGWFDHEPHKQEKCTTCHKADTSKAASDLLLPGIAQCRDCHQGETATKAEVPSSCAMCHTYHPRDGAAAAPPRIARK